MIVRRSVMLCAACLIWASTVHAQEPRAEGLSPTWFWLSASATIVCASLGGFYALDVRNLYDQALMEPPVSPNRAKLHDEMARTEVTADLLLLGSLVLAAGTTILAFHVDWSGHEHVQPRAAFDLRGARASFALDSGGPPAAPRAAPRRSFW